MPRLKTKEMLRDALGDQWGKMVVLFVMLTILPAWTLIIGEYSVAAILFLACLGPFITYVLLRRLVGVDGLRRLLRAAQSALVSIVALCLVAEGVHYAFQRWYPHTSSTLVYTNGNWMQGEKRNCFLTTGSPHFVLDCTIKSTESDPHRFDVTYTGADPSEQSRDKPQVWTCMRGSDSVSCAHE